ncbi:hypothetical protein JKF63_07548 [Porcisia hertigi]|uniref:Glycosyltransferase 2-like domain-containing protein n=1 Tax=Porcisia hertigi TaxID=2761500 RepID=A0A837A9U0_9TRYP|nr:hypothetical protein JKF63_07548 [Porcisia hertigi]
MPSEKSPLSIPPLHRVVQWPAVRIALYLLLLTIAYLAPLCVYFERHVWVTFEDTHRPGETFISDERFFQCMADRLSQSEEHSNRIPYVILPVTLDYQDIKVLFCNITAPITYVMFINNGEFVPLRKLLDRLSDKMSDYLDKRLFIIHHPENVGYAAAVNEGLRHALTFSVERVPWVFITNADVRFGQGLIEDFIAKVNKETENQTTRIKELEAEVAAEPTALKNVADARFTYRSDKLPVVTAPSLPYRIRAMPPEEMVREFEDTYGVFYTSHVPYMSTFALPRLTIATVGFFDENNYPAYGEDNDYAWRIDALGFKVYCSKRGRYVHIENANLNVDNLSKKYGSYKYTAYAQQSLKFVRMHYPRNRIEYRRTKWFPDQQNVETHKGRMPLPFRGNLPVDMWVMDTQRLKMIIDIGEGRRCRFVGMFYNLSLLDFNVSAITDHEQK